MSDEAAEAPVRSDHPSGRRHLLEASGLRKLYGKKAAVADVSFSMDSG
ncbi:MAG: hypothetical protein JNG85_09460, partial [Spirochaetaceae bacterium]|nr:hypothetical protein [Spirochaetaceae bacterium]